MKKFVLGAALVCVAIACNSAKTSSVSDAEKASVKSDCCPTNSAQCATDPACAEKKASCDKQVCPVTGKQIN